MSSDDDLGQFIGSMLLSVDLTDDALKNIEVDFADIIEHHHGGIQFVNFRTNTGMFQLVVYNAHNGYYGHDILIVKDQDVLLTDTI
jgi:hypothetical protein